MTDTITKIETKIVGMEDRTHAYNFVSPSVPTEVFIFIWIYLEITGDLHIVVM